MKNAYLMMPLGVLFCVVFISAAMAQDWPQWRGPERTGAIAGGVKLIEAVPDTGLTELWKSEPIVDVGGQESTVGFSSPIAAGGCVYLYLNQKVKDESPFRLTWGLLNRLGCFDILPPEELTAKMEAARTSRERMVLKSDAIPAWANDWIVRNLTHAQYVTVGARIEDRLIRGAEAISLTTLNQLEALKDKPYTQREELEKALADTGLEQERITGIITELTANRKRALDVIFCFNAETGKTIWKKEYPGALFEYGTSSTPAIVGDHIYVSGGKMIYCLNIKDGSEIWQVPCPAKEVSSSPIVADGMLLIQAGALCGLDASTGKLRWTRPEFKGIHASPTIWRKDGRAYAVQNIGLVDLQTGNLMWCVGGGGGDASPVVADDVLVSCSPIGIIHGYRLAADKPQEIWQLPGYSPLPSTPILFQGHLYATKAQGGPLFCADLATGKIVWTSPDKGFGTSAFNTESCILVDGKVFIDNHGAKGEYYLTMVRANPDKFELVGKGKIVTGNLRSSTPTIADGRLFIRGKDALTCYDLRAK